jgi:hypothetical protein
MRHLGSLAIACQLAIIPSALRHILPKACEWPSGLGDLFAGDMNSVAIFIMGASFSGSAPSSHKWA